MLRPLIILPMLITIGGCGGNVKEVSCAGKNWRQTGYETAHEGKSVRTFDTLREKCATPPGEEEKLQYIDGFTRGIVEYCTYDSGYTVGLANQSMKDVCPVEVRGEFVKGYETGQRDYAERIRRMDQISEQNDRDFAGDSARRATTPSGQ